MDGDAEPGGEFGREGDGGAGLHVLQVAGGAVGHGVVGVAEVGAAGELREADDGGALPGGQGDALAEPVVVLGGVGVPAHLDEADAQRVAFAGLGAARGAEGDP